MRVVISVDLEAEQRDRLTREFPDVEFVDAIGTDAVLQAAPSADVIFGAPPKTVHIAAAQRLRWVMAYSAGVNAFPRAELAQRGIVLTNASGAHAIPIAENILAMMLAFAIRLPDLIRSQDRREWNPEPVRAVKFELDGATLFIAGLGGIGAALAKKACALGMRVLGFRNRALPPPPGVAEMIGRDTLLQALGRADHVALCLPLTDATSGFIGEAELRAMKPTAYLYNVGRGKSIVQEALLRALEEGWIAGAGLDVTDPEPLPADDPLWSYPNVVLSQHTSGSSADLDRRVTDIFIANMHRFLDGQPLENAVDYERGY